LTIRGCILGIKKEAPQKTWRFLNSAGVGAGFRLSRTAVSFTVEDSAIYPTPVQIRATPPPGNNTTRNKILSKNVPDCISNVRPPHEACQYFSIPSFGYLLSVCRGGGGEIRGWENGMQGWTGRRWNGIVNLTKIPLLAHHSPGENPLICQGLRCALHTSNQPNLALVDNTFLRPCYPLKNRCASRHLHVILLGIRLHFWLGRIIIGLSPNFKHQRPRFAWTFACAGYAVPFKAPPDRPLSAKSGRS